ncbi:MAG: pantoate--beta-alanine ligase [Planctomycetota bacterium]|nr:pantoate--beta-alanine ligase [Planctomycetota bacterium]
MELCRSKTELRQLIAAWKREGLRIGFVPTMGALHEGHLSLMRAARQECDRIVVSIYVNPTQFDRKDDLDAYPHDPERDRDLLKTVSCDALFTINNEDMYPDDFSTWVIPEGSLVGGLCGKSRGSHFKGVTTIVTKLFNIVGAHKAFFGQKDYQQFAIIQRMVRDLDIPIEVASCPTVREADGLALSSRNQLLESTHRERSLAIAKSLAWATLSFRAGQKKASLILAEMVKRIEEAGAKVDYIEAVDCESLAPKETLDDQSVIAVAAFFGAVRLIDNHILKDDFPVQFP